MTSPKGQKTFAWVLVAKLHSMTLSHLQIPITDDVKAKLAARAAESGHASVESYVASLLQEDALLIEYGVPEHLRTRSREQLESQLVEGLKSRATEMTAVDWNQMRRDLIGRHRPSKAG